jgi:hypothetical protein
MIVLKRFDWDSDTLKYYANLLRHLHYWRAFYDIYNFVESEYVLEQDEAVIDVAADLMRQVEEWNSNDTNETKEETAVNS